MFEEIQKLSRRFLEIKNSPYRRYLIRENPFSHRLSILVGPRGVGKTTSLVQELLKNVEGDSLDPKILYVQADHFLVSSLSLYEIAEQFQMLGGKWIVFDEIHKYSNWSKELKSIYDTFDRLKIYASGSSALEIFKGTHDLARRSAVFHMHGMSFREYLELSNSIELNSYEIDEICSEHIKIANSILQKLKEINKNIIPEFNRYLQFGYYPYYYEINDESIYKMTLEQNVHTTIESDLASIYPQLTGASLQKMKKLLAFIAGAVPFIPNWNHILSTVEIGDLRTLKTYFSHLEDAGMIRSVSRATKKFKGLETPAKIYLDNPNLLYAISSEAPEKGTVRETFFLNAVASRCSVSIPGDGDFLVDEKYLFEVGGKNKGFDQIKATQNGFLACDDIEQGVRAKIPLWLFGFLY
jgi:hypothetical protein